MRHLRPLLAFVTTIVSTFAADPAFDRFADTFAADWMRADPQASTKAQYFTGPEQDQLDRQLTPPTRAFRAARVAAAQQGLAALARFDRKQLSAEQRVSADLLAWALTDIVEGFAYADFDWVFDQFNGLHVELVNFLSQMHPVRNPRDIENYLARLDQVAARLDEGIARARDAASRGFVMPRFIYTAALGQLDRFLADSPRKNVLVASLDERAAKLSSLSVADRARFVAATEKTVAAAVIPAFRRVQAMLREQQARATDDAGIWRLPGGDKAYAFYLRRMTTTDFTPEQVHELGLKEVARISADMDRILRQLGYTTGTLEARVEKLQADIQPPATPDPRPALLARNEAYVREAEKRAANLFDLRPAAPLVVKREPPFTEETASAHYEEPARDGSRPGVFWTPLPGPTYDILTMRTTAYHEAVPGHHFQIALQQEMKSLPRFRQDGIFGFISAHGEGWALYAEKLAVEDGWYEGDPQGHLGQLSDELFRARRLVVDTGLHTKRWTRQQAIDYALPVSEVERYIVWPGQACSYKVGQLKILELRAKAKSILGPKFSIKAFHNVILRNGNIPLDVLSRIIDDYLAAAR
ncbi:MAG: DUF885 domain-containing protein [Verrucomicrobia bacterium]|nr:DUF885 domain-containing protein [Verrucomicrobiota bacterium]